MIISEVKTLNGVQYNYYYSDAGRYLVSENGGLYEEVYDPIFIIRTYTEGPLIEPEEEPTEEDFAQVGRIMIGYEDNGQSNTTT